MRLFILLGLYTGAKSGAILDLTWDRVDMERRLIDYRTAGRISEEKARRGSDLKRIYPALKLAYEMERNGLCNRIWGKAHPADSRGFIFGVQRAGFGA